MQRAIPGQLLTASSVCLTSDFSPFQLALWCSIEICSDKFLWKRPCVTVCDCLSWKYFGLRTRVEFNCIYIVTRFRQVPIVLRILNTMTLDDGVYVISLKGIWDEIPHVTLKDGAIILSPLDPASAIDQQVTYYFQIKLVRHSTTLSVVC